MGRAFVELFSRNTMLYRGLDEAKNRLKSWGAGLAKSGGGMAAAGGGVYGPLQALGKQALDRSAEVEKLSARFGTAAEDVSGLAYAFERGGMDIKDFGNWLDTLAGKVGAAADANEELIQGLRGLNGRQLLNKSVPEQINLIADALSSIVNDQDRVNAANALGLGDMLPYLTKGRESLTALRAEAQKVGAVLSGQEAKEGKAIAEQWDRVWRETQTTLLAVGKAILPTSASVGTIGDMVSKTLGDVRGWVEENKDLIRIVGQVAGVVVAAGVVIAGFGGSLSAVGMGVSFIAAALPLILNPVTLTVAALTALVAWFLTSTETGRQWADAIGGYFKEVWGTAQQTFQGISDALAVGDWQGAFKIGVAGLNVEWRRFCVFFQSGWRDTAGFFTDLWFDAEAQVKSAWIDLFDWIEKAQTAEFWQGLWDGMVDAFAARMEGIGSLFEATLNNMVAGAEKVFSKIGEALLNPMKAGEIIQALVDAPLTAVGLTDAQIETAKQKVANKAVELEQKRKEVEQAIGEAGADPILKGKDAVAKEAADKKRAAREALQQGVDQAQKELQEAQDELKRMTDDAERKKNTAVFKAFMDGDWSGGEATKRIAAAQRELPSLVKGIFAGPAQMQLNYSDQTAKRQLDAAVTTAANTKVLPNIDKKIGQVADALKFGR